MRPCHALPILSDIEEANHGTRQCCGSEQANWENPVPGSDFEHQPADFARTFDCLMVVEYPVLHPLRKQETPQANAEQDTAARHAYDAA
jgi:hypothetical protein